MKLEDAERMAEEASRRVDELLQKYKQQVALNQVLADKLADKREEVHELTARNRALVCGIEGIIEGVKKI